jgi:hypothetical protein
VETANLVESHAQLARLRSLQSASMKRPRFIVFALGLMVSPAWGDGGCLHYHYMGDPVVLEGTVGLRTFFGPPNYGENPKTDSRETQAILTLEKAVCVDAKPSDYDEAERNQTEVTLVPSRGENLQVFEGKDVAVLGQLFHANTGHHHTPLLIQVQRIQEPLDLRLLDGGLYEAGGRTFANATELESFLREYKAVRIHLLPSKGVAYKQVEAALKAIQSAGGADIGLVGNVAPE